MKIILMAPVKLLRLLNHKGIEVEFKAEEEE
jgi:hypothetical protein